MQSLRKLAQIGVKYATLLITITCILYLLCTNHMHHQQILSQHYGQLKKDVAQLFIWIRFDGHHVLLDLSVILNTISNVSGSMIKMMVILVYGYSSVQKIWYVSVWHVL
jgi:hypothetical protein